VKPAETSNAQLPHRFTIAAVRRTFLLLIAVIALVGCGRDDGEAEVPAHCKDAATVTAAAVDQGSISDCLAKDSSVGDVQLVGAAMLAAAQQLGDEGNELALGYLVGAMRHGSDFSQGIYAEAVRRVEQEARPFRRSAAFKRGLRAGRTSG
jgi:hypothetical protein